MDEDTKLFLTEWLKEARNNQVSKSCLTNPEVIEAIYSLIEEWKSNKDLTSILCLQFFGFYRSGDLNIKVFTLQFIPSLVFSYLSGIAKGEKKDVGNIQTLLLAIYNLEAGEEAQKLKTQSFRVPNLAQPSIYHEPLGLAPSALTESALKRLDPANRITVKFGPHPHLQSFNAENRLPATAALLRIYSEHLGMYSSTSLAETCLAFTRLVTQGFTHQTEHAPRIPLSSQILVEILRIIYSLTPLDFSCGSKQNTPAPTVAPNPASAPAISLASIGESIEEAELGVRAQQALEAVQSRVEVELMPAPILMSAAINNSSSLSIKGVSSTSQLVSSASTAGTRTQWKSMITNASFRTKKLPDDITVASTTDSELATTSTSSLTLPLNAGATVAQPSTPGPPAAREALGSISEENDEPTSKSFRLPELSQLVKKKDKSKQLSESTSKSKVGKQAKSSKSTNGINDYNGGNSNGNGNSSLTDNGTTITLSSPAEWMNSDSDAKEEMDLRRKSAEFNHVSTQV